MVKVTERIARVNVCTFIICAIELSVPDEQYSMSRP